MRPICQLLYVSLSLSLSFLGSQNNHFWSIYFLYQLNVWFSCLEYIFNLLQYRSCLIAGGKGLLSELDNTLQPPFSDAAAAIDSQMAEWIGNILSPNIKSMVKFLSTHIWTLQFPCQFCRRCWPRFFALWLKQHQTFYCDARFPAPSKIAVPNSSTDQMRNKSWSLKTPTCMTALLAQRKVVAQWYYLHNMQWRSG